MGFFEEVDGLWIGGEVEVEERERLDMHTPPPHSIHATYKALNNT